MNADDLTPGAWGTLVDETTPATYGALIDQLAERLDLSNAAATDVIEQALDAETIVEVDGSGAYPEVIVPDRADQPQEATTEADDDQDPSEATEEETEDAGTHDEQIESGEEAESRAMDFISPNRDVWAPELLDREQWMGHVEKCPFAPWGDRDHPEAAPDKDARWKWGLDENYVDGATVAIAEDDPRLDGRAFLQQDDDPYVFVDGDDVRCPETGEVHPEFVAILERLGRTYTDISVSGSGSHANYRGKLPEGIPQTSLAIADEPWGANDDLPEVEIYANKHVCVQTGKHVPGTPTEIREWDADEVRELLNEYDQLPTHPDIEDERETFDPDEHTPSATDSSETTHDVRDQFAAVNRIDARHVATDTIVHRWNDDASTSDGKRAFVPTWDTSANGTANVVDDEIWQDTGGGGYGGPVVMALIDDNELRPDSARPRDTRGKMWFKGVDLLRDLGYEIPRYESSSDEEETVDPTTFDVVVDPERAWEAATAVEPADLDTDEEEDDEDTRTISLDTTADGWECPGCGETVGIVRAVAIDRGHCTDCQEPLDNAAYSDAYRRAHREYGAPLPEYVNAQMATERWDVIQGALEQLTHRHLDAIRSTVVSTARDDPEIIAEIDPCWEESASGKRIIAFRDGPMYCREHERVLDPVRVVALEEGLIDACDSELSGANFRDAYQCVRERGAPLPRWICGTPDHAAVLPPAEELVGEFTTERDRLEAARSDVEDGYRMCATDADTMHVRTDDPALGKTTSAVKTAQDRPTLYTAPRKELQQDVSMKAEKYGVTSMILPVFGGGGNNLPVERAKQLVREEGQDLLTERETLYDRVSDEEEDDDNTEHSASDESDEQVVAQPGEEASRTAEAQDDEEDDEVALDRAKCSTASGAHGEDWQLVVHVARELDFSPAEIHQNAEELFGEPLPCQCEDEDADEHDDAHTRCQYSRAWERVSDPERPIDLLIGSYGHTHVASARTHYERVDDRTDVSPRTIAIDEFPGTAFGRSFGDEALDHAVWLTTVLTDQAIDTRQELIESDLWDDDWVRAWLRGTGDEHAATEQASRHLSAAEAWLDVRDAIEQARYSATAIDDATLDRLGDADPRTDMDAISAAHENARDAWDGPSDRSGRLLLDELRAFFSASSALETDLGSIDHGFEGVIGRLLDRAMHACQDDAIGRGVITRARKALTGGEEGCRVVAVESDAAYAHPLAYLLLYAAIEESDQGADHRISTTDFAWDRKRDGTTVKRSAFDDATILLDDDHKGAYIHDPPAFTARDGGATPVVGLDATGRAPLWSLVLGSSVETANVHETVRERRAFLRDVFNVQVVQTTPHMKFYEGSTGSKNFSADIELVREVAREYGDKRIRADRLETTGKPGVLTTKCVRTEIEDQLDDDISAIDNYGNVTGSNALAGCRLGVVLGTQHYGHARAEKWAALAGEEVTATGHGTALDYESEIANEFLGHMTKDQTMQAILRFGRDEGGALVFAHTAALREELPVTADGAVVTAHSESERAVRQAMRPYLRQQTSFTKRDILDDDAVECSERTVQRALAGFTELGYLDRHDPGEGLANSFTPVADPGLGETSLPEVEGTTSAPEAAGEDTPDRSHTSVYYTGSVGVRGDDRSDTRHAPPETVILPAPEEVSAGPLPR